MVKEGIIKNDTEDRDMYMYIPNENSASILKFIQLGNVNIS